MAALTGSIVENRTVNTLGNFRGGRAEGQRARLEFVLGEGRIWVGNTMPYTLPHLLGIPTFKLINITVFLTIFGIYMTSGVLLQHIQFAQTIRLVTMRRHFS